eukprot:COSAG05_NODE_289_length_12065_cov_9.271519_3_plen_113_part_00
MIYALLHCMIIGYIQIETPGHCPTKVTVNGVTTEYPLPPYRSAITPTFYLYSTSRAIHGIVNLTVFLFCMGFGDHPYSYMGGYPQCNQHGFFYEVEAVPTITLSLLWLQNQS